MKKLYALIIVIVFVLATSTGQADIPHLINYQGMLTEDAGIPLTGNFNLTFKIYSQSSGGSALWTETQNGVSVVDGLFNVILGSSVPVPSSVFSDTLRYLGITVEPGAELTPRIRLTSVGYAYRAKVADSASVAVSAPTGGGWTDDGEVVRLETSSDSVGIGTASPSAKLDIRGTLNVGANASGYDVNFYGTDSGSRLFWNQSKMAFRAGKATGVKWDDSWTGTYSVAIGYNALASGLSSIAMGGGAEAHGIESVALGNNVTTEGWASVALGRETKAEGAVSFVAGIFSEAYGPFSVAIGRFATSDDTNSVAIGQYVTADTVASFVIGTGFTGMNRLVNNIPQSLMIGFGSTTPTLFVNGTSVGIGTTAPSAKLHLENSSGDNSLKIRCADGDTTSLKLFEGNDYGFEFEYSGTDDKLHLWSRKFSGNEGIRMTWLKNGDVGIGTTAPEEMLEIENSEYMSRAFLKIQTSHPTNFEEAGLRIETPQNRWHLRMDDYTNDNLPDAGSLALRSQNSGYEVMTWLNNGRVGICNTNPAYRLDVNGDINASGNIRKGGTAYTHPDYVFEPDYELMSLEDLKEYVFEKKCLPNVISAEDVKKNNGYNMDELLIQMLEKIEEQTLYIFQLEERIAELERGK